MSDTNGADTFVSTFLCFHLCFLASQRSERADDLSMQRLNHIFSRNPTPTDTVITPTTTIKAVNNLFQ